MDFYFYILYHVDGPKIKQEKQNIFYLQYIHKVQ